MERTPEIDRRAAIRRAAAVGVTISALPAAAAAASGDGVGGLSSPETTMVPAPPDEIVAPVPKLPVDSAIASMTTLTIDTDRSLNPTLTYRYREDPSGEWVTLAQDEFMVDITNSASPLSIRVERRTSTDVLDAASLVTITKQVDTVSFASGGLTRTIADSDSGTRGVSVIAVGGRGGRGGNDGLNTGGAPANPGRVEATYDIPKGTVLVARAGSGGVNGQDAYVGQVGQVGGAGGTNGLSRSGADGTYSGGKGGDGGVDTRSGGGGGGGAASVLQIGAGTGAPLVVAAGSGGGGGAESTNNVNGAPGAFDATKFRTSESPSVTSTDGSATFSPRIGDYAGHGAGGGGFLGGTAERGSNVQRRGQGGYTGQSYAAPTAGSIVRVGSPTESFDTQRSVGGAGFVQLTYWTVAIS